MSLRWKLTVWLACALAGGLLPAALVAAQGPIAVQASEHRFDFGHSVRFDLTVQSEAPIQSIVLTYRTSDTQGMTIEPIAFDPATTVSVSHTHHVGQRYIRPFVEITYWWKIDDAAGDTLKTSPQSFVYADDRWAWQTQSAGAVNVHWYQGDIRIAQQVLDVAGDALGRARQDVAIGSMYRPIEIYLYANAEELQRALPAGLPAGAEALTLYETSVVLVPYGPEGANIPHLRRIVPHEVTHALIYAVTQSEFDRVPLWLSEGLATSVEYTFAPDPEAETVLEKALNGQGLHRLSTLCAAFPRDWEGARLAYAQSASVVDHIRDLYGRQALWDLVAAYADGATCEGGVQRALGFSLDHLEASWRERMGPGNRWLQFWVNNGAWVLVLVLFAVPLLLFLRPARYPVLPLEGEAE